MGYSKFNYVGPYLKVDCPPQTDFRNFCDFELKEKLCTAWTANELTFKGFAYVMPSEHEKTPRAMFIKNNCDFSEQANLNPLSEMDWFKETFKKELAAFQAEYPNYPFSVEWGVLTFAY